MFGVAVLATVFTTVGGYASPGAFVDGLAWALWIGAVMVGLGAVAALGIPGRQATLRHAAVPGGLALTISLSMLVNNQGTAERHLNRSGFP